MLSLAERLRLPEDPAQADDVVTLVLTEVRDAMIGLRIRRVRGQQQIYIKPVPELLSGVRALAGFTILGDGRPVFVLEPNHLI